MSDPSDTANIIVVDDTPANLKLLSGMLREKGYKVRPFPRARLALAAARHDPPDLILLDINMPEMNGFEMAEALKADEGLAGIPIIFISALTETLDKVRAFRAGAVDYIAKPFQLEEVNARVETHLALRHTQRELQARNAELETTLADLKDAQTQLVQSEKMASLGVLTAGLAHEINNPINFVSASAGGLEAVLPDFLKVLKRYDDIHPETAAEDLKEIAELKDKLDFDEIVAEVKEASENIRQGSRRAADIVANLRTFSRMDEGEKTSVDLHENLEFTLVMLNHLFEGGIKIRKEYSDLPPVLCRSGQLNQVFLNILNNAIDAIHSKESPGPEETITITTRLEDKGDHRDVVVEFTDTGPGIPPEAQPKIFDPFFTTKPVGKGTGLGLSISIGIVRSHDGVIEAESEPGHGATFRVRFPLVEQS